MLPHQRLEKEFGAWIGFSAEKAVSCSSGTNAIHLGIESLRLPLGSFILCPTFTMIACARAISMAGHEPVFVDCRPDLLIDPQLVEDACDRFGKQVRAVMAVHVFGRRVGMDAIAAVAKERDLIILEDLAEAHGIAVDPATDVAAYSFYKNKIIASKSEGGLVAFRDPGAATVARRLRCLGFDDAHSYVHLPRGVNARLADSLAEEILASLADYAGNLLERRLAERWYDNECPDEWRMPRRDAPWIYDLKVPGLTRDRQLEVVRALNAEGVAARMSFLGMHRQPEYVGCRVLGGAVADRASESIFYLPLQPGAVSTGSARKAFDVIHKTLAF